MMMIHLPHSFNGRYSEETWIKSLKIIIQEIPTQDVETPGSLVVAVEMSVNVEA